MIHAVQQTYALFADRDLARTALSTLLREDACVAARIVGAAGVWPWRLEALWPPAPARPTGCRVGVAEVHLAEFQRGHGWSRWRRTAAIETATELARLLRTAGVPWDCAGRNAASIAAELYFHAEGGLVEDCARLICEVSLRANAPAAPRRAS